MAQKIDFERYNPMRSPAWRLERVMTILHRPSSGPGRSTPRDDPYVKGFREFLLLYQNGTDEGRNRLAYKFPGAYFAYKIYESRTTLSVRLAIAIESRLLAGQDDLAIAGELCTLPETIEWYEAMFFHVRDRLQAHDWIIDQVLMPAYLQTRKELVDSNKGRSHHLALPQFGEPYFDATIKWFAYFGGSFVLDQMLSGFRRGAVARTRESVDDWMDGTFKSRMRQRANMAAQLVEINRYNVMELMAINTKLIEIQQSSDDQQSKTDQMHQAIGAMMKSMRWAVGDEGKAMVAKSVLASYDDGAAELRDSEAFLLVNDRAPAAIEKIKQLTLPSPEKVKPEPEAANAGKKTK